MTDTDLTRSTATELLLTIIDRLTARVAELEAWQARMADEVVTKRVTVQCRDGAPSVQLLASDFWAEVRVALGDSDRDAVVSLLACDESTIPEASINLRVDDQDRWAASTLRQLTGQEEGK